MPSRFGQEPEPKPPDPPDPDEIKIDTSQPYDIYCWERDPRIVVYRNARFKGTRELYRSGQFDSACEFIVIEQSNGETVFLHRHSILKFCRPGTKLTSEQLGHES